MPDSLEKPTSPALSPGEMAIHRRLAGEFFNAVWKLLDKRDRTAEEDARMIHLAHASRLHWEFAGGALEAAVGEWQVSRVHAVLRQPEAALYHARRALELAERNGLGAFQAGCGHEAMARALAVANPQAALAHVAAGRKLLAEITDPEEKKLLEEDLGNIGL